VVPVAINYDRLFEIRNLTDEIVNGDRTELSMVQVLRMLMEQADNKLGKVYMTFGKSISVDSFVNEQRLAPITPDNLDRAALELTSHLVLQQELASPVVLNMIVASLLLQSQTKHISLDSLHRNVAQIYDYLDKRGGFKMVMRQTPTKISVLNTVRNLGFHVVENVSQRGKKLVKKQEIWNDAKSDQKVLLGLSYYSNNLL